MNQASSVASLGASSAKAGAEETTAPLASRDAMASGLGLALGAGGAWGAGSTATERTGGSGMGLAGAAGASFVASAGADERPNKCLDLRPGDEPPSGTLQPQRPGKSA